MATNEVKKTCFFIFFSLFRLIKQKPSKEFDGQGVKKIISLNDPHGLYAMRCCIAMGPPTQNREEFLQNKKRIRAVIFYSAQSDINVPKNIAMIKDFLRPRANIPVDSHLIILQL